MLTFSEALTLLKTGEDMRVQTWPPGHFVRLVVLPQRQEIRGYAGTPYIPTQAELLGHNWSKT